ncbi:unnamed protein product [Citrullus colocynthis]|uniref:Uncharacterized protein n=1 Tax=Citrullus colocynthis TaxID=252529 RepID=A0ABP0Z729_9ROSI
MRLGKEKKRKRRGSFTFSCPLRFQLSSYPARTTVYVQRLDSRSSGRNPPAIIDERRTGRRQRCTVRCVSVAPCYSVSSDSSERWRRFRSA